jgi:hypothetical protein
MNWSDKTNLAASAAPMWSSPREQAAARGNVGDHFIDGWWHP